MESGGLAQLLRQEPFYMGQILRVRRFQGTDAEICPIGLLLKNIPRLEGGSLSIILGTLGYTNPYASFLGALGQAFPLKPGEPEDAILVSPYSPVREEFWQLVCILEALDEARRCLVLCPDEARAKLATRRLRSILRRADIEYALQLVEITTRASFGEFNDSVPMVAVLTPEMLAHLLHSPALLQVREAVLSALGRVILPCLESWQPALATHVAFLMRELQLACVLQGSHPALAATSARVGGIEEFTSTLWGRPIESRSFVEADSVESVPVQLINYSGALVRDPASSTRWVRQDPVAVAEDLLGWLVGKFPGRLAGGYDLHYLIDASGSMTDRIDAVKGVVARDFRNRVDAGISSPDDRVRLSAFDTQTELVYEGSIEPSMIREFEAVLDGVQATGGTDIPTALGASLHSAIESTAAQVDIAVFSDGESPISADAQLTLLELVRRARSRGQAVRILYVALDMDPPVPMRNLIEALGGRILTQSTDDLRQVERIGIEEVGATTVVLLSGESGLPEDIIQKYQTGKRRLVYTRDIASLDVKPEEVFAVVVSGRFPEVGEIRDCVRHWGRGELPVFLLTPAEASAQLLVNDYPIGQNLVRRLLIWDRNTAASTQRLAAALGNGSIDAMHFRYLLYGAPAFKALLDDILGSEAPSGRGEQPPLAPSEIPPEFELDRKGGRWVVSPIAKETPDEIPAAQVMTVFSENVVVLEGKGISVLRDADAAPLSYHPGAVFDTVSQSAEIRRVLPDKIELCGRSVHLTVPIVLNPRVEKLRPDVWSQYLVRTQHLGDVSHGEVQFDTEIAGVRRYPHANLDDTYDDEMMEAATQIQFRTYAAQWTPTDASPEIVVGLANLLRLCSTLLYPAPEQKVFIFPDTEKESILLVDLVKGGNGASAPFHQESDLLAELIALGGRIALECPCEQGLAGVRPSAALQTQDTGCPRCTRVVGPVILDSGRDRFADVHKQQLLAWLERQDFLPDSAHVHLEEKYKGINDSLRISGPDRGSRRGVIRLVRQVLSDRLGLDISDTLLGSFAWLDGESEYAGLYESGPNRLSIKKDLKEWVALDVMAHEVFHNLQYKLEGLFDHGAIGKEGHTHPPFDGKLFIEGSAMWAESHAVDFFALRSSLNAANLRVEKDEYAHGFQLMKYIEENHGGVSAVLKFLRTGDISQVTDGKYGDLASLYADLGIVTP